MPNAPLLQRFVEDELGLAPALIQRVVAGVFQLLGPSKDAEIGAGERALNADVVKALQRDGPLFEQRFVAALRTRVKAELDELTATEEAAVPSPAAPGGLELMDESRVDVDIEISRAMQLIDSTAEWELRELQTFTSTLTGSAHVTAESNPLRPLAYATALWEAASATVSAHAQRAVLLRTSAGVCAGLLKNAWAAAATRLENQGVEPGTYRTVVLPSGAAFGRSPPADPSRSGALASLLASMPSSGAGGGAGTSVAGTGAQGVRNDSGGRRSPELEQALLRLGELLRRLPSETSLAGRAVPTATRIEQHRAALVASAADPMDRQIIELVTRLFEALLADSQLPAPLRPLFSRMQVSVLRTALAEHAVLDAWDHPVWRLLDRIGETALGYSRLEDPRLAAFLAFAGAVAEEMAGASSPDTALYRRGLSRIDTFLTEQMRAQLWSAQPAVEALQRAERREILEPHLAKRLTDQMVPVRTSATIRRFVTGTWAKVIAENMLRTGEQSEATLADLRTVDDLLWSLRIPDHPQSRQRLLTLLPGLLQRLRTGMELVALPASERQAVLNELMTIHTEALRPGTKGAGALTPEEIVQRMRDEIVPDLPIPRSFSDSVIDLSSMETVPVDVLPSSGGPSSQGGGAGADDDPAKRVDALRAGDRARVFLQGRWSRLQLLWRSDRGLFYLFAGESPTRTHSITRRALERLSGAGLVQAIEAKPLVQRAADRMMRELDARG